MTITVKKTATTQPRSATTSRLEQRLRDARREGAKSFIPFVTAGDPDLATTERIIVELAGAGAAAIEVGVPFSDPVADGPIIQRACMRAVAGDTNMESILAMCRRVASQTDVPLVLFSYLNPLLAFGLERLALEARDCGIAAVLPTDLPFDSAGPMRNLLRHCGVDLISIIPPNTAPERLRRIAAAATGFLYLVTRTGITGDRTAELASLEPVIADIRSVSDVPIALGFGIATPADARRAWTLADGAVVGSALVSLIEQGGSTEAIVGRVRTFAGGFTRHITVP